MPDAAIAATARAALGDLRTTPPPVASTPWEQRSLEAATARHTTLLERLGAAQAGIPADPEGMGLPPGIWHASRDAFMTRFGTTDSRQAIIANMYQAFDVLGGIGWDQVIVGGSLLTGADPHDADFVYGRLHPETPLNASQQISAENLLRPLGLDNHVSSISSAVIGPRFDAYPAEYPIAFHGDRQMLDMFQHDRQFRPRGVVLVTD